MRVIAISTGISRPSARTAVISTCLPSNRDSPVARRSEEHTSELQSLRHLVCRLLLEKKKNIGYEVSPQELATQSLKVRHLDVRSDRSARGKPPIMFVGAQQYSSLADRVAVTNGSCD